MNYEKLVELLKKERESSSLSKVEETLYEDMEKLLKEKEEKKGEGILFLREYENSKRLVEKVKEERIKKLFYFALKGISPNNAIEKEMVLYEEFKASIRDFGKIKIRDKKKEVGKIENKEEAERKEKKEEEIGKEEEGKKKIKITRFVEAYKGIDGLIYGPYSPGEVVEIEEEEAKWLVENGYAEN